MDDAPSRRYPTALGFASALEASARGGHVTDALRDLSAISAVAPLVEPPVTVGMVMDEPEDVPEDETVSADLDELSEEVVVDGEVLVAAAGADGGVIGVTAARAPDEARSSLLPGN